MSDTSCSRCFSGTVTYDEDGRTVRDTCYHCGGTGLVPVEQRRDDDLHDVVETLAMLQAQQYRHALDNRDDEDRCEDFTFAAAEHGLRPDDFLTEIAWSYERDIATRLAALPAAMQDVLIAWVSS